MTRVQFPAAEMKYMHAHRDEGWWWRDTKLWSVDMLRLAGIAIVYMASGHGAESCKL